MALSYLPSAYAVEEMFSFLCVWVYVGVSLPACLTVLAVTFEPVDIDTSFWCGGTSRQYLGQV